MVITARLKQANLVTKTDFNDKPKSHNQTTDSNKTKYLLVENEFKKLQIFDSIDIRGRSYFEEDRTQYYLVFQPMHRYIKRVVNSYYILKWKSRGLSNERFKPPSASHVFLNPSLNYFGTKTRVRFNGICLQQDEIIYTPGKTVSIYLVYEITKNDNTSSDPTLKNRLFGAIDLSKNADIDKYKYSRYGIGFDRHGIFFSS